MAGAEMSMTEALRDTCSVIKYSHLDTILSLLVSNPVSSEANCATVSFI
jgi:hypothetical protein